MVVLGNLLLVIAGIIFLLMCKLLFFTRMPGGDASVGYAWSLILGIAVFSICLIIVTAIIGSNGGFSWVGGNRTLMVIAGLFLVLLGNGFFMTGESPSDLPFILRKMAIAIPGILPPLLLISAAILLNGKQLSVPGMVYKLPIYTGIVFGLIVFGILAFPTLQRSMLAGKRSGSSDNTRLFEQIDNTDVSKNWIFLMVYTDANHDKVVRERALERIKSRPDWQEEMVKRLQNDWAPEIFTFMASNDVPDKTMFDEALKEGISIQARLIRESIRKCRDKHDLYQGRFTWEVDRVIRTVNKFEGNEVNYRPAMQELRNALDEHTGFTKPKLPAKDMLDKWLKAH